jgi:hypothetical protein
VPALRGLATLELGRNRLTGTIPVAIFDSNVLNGLDLSSNQLTGTIPAVDTAKCCLERNAPSYFDLGSNQLEGTLPTTLNKLYRFSVAHNRLNGTIHTTIATFGDEVNAISLQNNSFTGAIPTVFGSLRELWWIDLSHNELTGTIPSELAALTRGELYVQFNKLVGTAPLLPNVTLYNVTNNCFDACNCGPCVGCLTNRSCPVLTSMTLVTTSSVESESTSTATTTETTSAETESTSTLITTTTTVETESTPRPDVVLSSESQAALSSTASFSVASSESRTPAAEIQTSGVETAPGVAGSQIAVIVGATAAGTAALTTLVVLAVFAICRRRKRGDDTNRTTMSAGGSREMSSARGDEESPYARIAGIDSSYALVEPTAAASYDELTLGPVYDAPPITHAKEHSYGAPPIAPNISRDL